MSGTTLTKLQAAWQKEKSAKHKRCRASAGKHWDLVCAAHNRKVLRKQYLVNRASRVAFYLRETNMWYQVTKGNRQILRIPPLIARFGNSGTPRRWQS